MSLLNGKNRLSQRRRGAITVLVALAIPMLLILSAFAVNVAYMQMVREQLRVTCDASAKAALVHYGSTQSQSSGISFAQTVANLNLVGGQPVTVSASNVVFGNATQGSGAYYAFTAGGTPINAVQLTGTVTPSLFLSTFMPISKFTTSQVSVATRVAHDICLVLDRSATMALDPTDDNYPTGANPIEGYFEVPSGFNPAGTLPSRWYELTLAVNSFISTLQSRNIDVHVSLVTFAETYSFGTYTATDATLEVPLPASGTTLTANCAAVQTAMNQYSTVPLLGATNISAGMTLAQSQLTGSNARTTADRTIILLSDGIATTGNTDIASIALSYRQSNQIITHTITFGPQAVAGSPAAIVMQNTASNGNGVSLLAPTTSQLQTAFQTIADSLPAVLIK